jgi:DNA-binding NarL/FixJ family response regulator
MHSEEQYISDALHAGVTGYVLKTEAAEDLVRAVSQVSLGLPYLSPKVSRSVLKAYLENTEIATDPLTPRERQVLQLIAEGETAKGMANLLGISVKTAEAHRARIMQKLEISGTAGLVRYAIRRGLVAS